MGGRTIIDPDDVEATRSLSWWRLAAIAFVMTSCGPFGIEPCVQNGGALLTFIAVLVVPIVYVIPQVLMVSELALMMPSMHGHIKWVEHGWGPFAGWFNAYNAIIVNTIDLALYPVLASNYLVIHFLPDASFGVVVLTRFAVIIIGSIIAITSAKTVSSASIGMALIIIVPFVVMFFMCVSHIQPAAQWTWSNGASWAVNTSALPSPAPPTAAATATAAAGAQLQLQGQRQQPERTIFRPSAWTSMYLSASSMSQRRAALMDTTTTAMGTTVEVPPSVMGSGSTQPWSATQKVVFRVFAPLATTSSVSVSTTMVPRVAPPGSNNKNNNASVGSGGSKVSILTFDMSSAMSQVEWGAFTASALWLFTGWNSLGALAGEVDDVAGSGLNNVFTQGLGMALILSVVMYVLPLMSALTVPGTWGDGYLSDAFDRALKGMDGGASAAMNAAVPVNYQQVFTGGGGLVVSMLGIASQFGLYCSSLVCYARLVWGMAELSWIPHYFAHLNPTTHSPDRTTVLLSLLILPLMFFDFSFLQRLEFSLAAISYILTFTAFLHLRYTEPDHPRPFLVPGGMPVAWLITATKVIVMLTVGFSNIIDPALLLTCIGVNGCIAAAYFLRSKSLESGGGGGGESGERRDERGGTTVGGAPGSAETGKISQVEMQQLRTGASAAAGGSQGTDRVGLLTADASPRLPPSGIEDRRHFEADFDLSTASHAAAAASPSPSTTV